MHVAPPGIEGIKRVILQEDGSTAVIDCNGTHLACAIAGKLASFGNPSDTLVRQTLAGFRASEDDFTPWNRAERAQMASNGVTVVTFDAGRFILLDPISTERAGGGLAQFEDWASSVQKDNISRKVTAALDTNLIGIVPIDELDFQLDIKQVISGVLSGAIAAGEIGPYVDAAGNRRAIDLNQDIIVGIVPNNPRQNTFKYFYNLRYPKLQLFGEYTVDSPFAVQV